MSKLDIHKIQLRHASLSDRIVLARFGKDPKIPLETRDVMSDFWQCLASYAFNGKMPDVGEKREIDFGGGDERFVLRIERVPG